MRLHLIYDPKDRIEPPRDSFTKLTGCSFSMLHLNGDVGMKDVERIATKIVKALLEEMAREK